MRFYTDQECADWCKSIDVKLDERNHPFWPTKDDGLRCGFPPSASGLLGFSRRIENALQPRQSCLFWVTGWGIDPLSENLQLYYRFRQSYGDFRLLNDAPGHLFLNYESSDLVSYIYLALLNSWDVHLFPTVGYGTGFICHDEWIQLNLEDKVELETIRQEFKKWGCKF